jgi:Flp pilus assembly protein TadD
MGIKHGNIVLIILMIILVTSCSVFQSPGASAISFNEGGLRSLKANEFEKAVNSFTKAIEVDPKMGKAYEGRGEAFDHLGNYEKAVLDYTQAIQLNPDSSIAYFN